MQGIKFLRDKKGNPKQLLIDIDKHYDIIENVIDVIEAETRLKETGKIAELVFKEIREDKNKKDKKR